MNQLIHQESGTSNHQNFTSNSGTLLPKTIIVVSAITGRLNYHSIYNDDIEVQPSYYLFESTSESVPDTGTTIIKSTDDYEMDHLL